jgi:hypothetical protein
MKEVSAEIGCAHAWKHGPRTTLLTQKQQEHTMNDQGKEIGKIIAKCWSDEAFKQKLLADPAATLKAEGVALPAGIQIKAIEDTAQTVHLVIPANPTELSDEQLDSAAGGFCMSGICSR